MLHGKLQGALHETHQGTLHETLSETWLDGQKPYDYDPLGALEKITGPTLRPGGLDLTKRALNFCAFPKGAKIIDAGCGPGATLKLLSDMGFEALGVDKSPKFIKEAEKNGTVLEGSLESLPLNDSSVDGLLCECVLNLAVCRERALREIYRVLKRDGLFVLTDIFIEEQFLSAKEAEAQEKAKEEKEEKVATEEMVETENDAAIPSAQIPKNTCLSGAKTLSLAGKELEDNGFAIRLIEDHGQALKNLAAKLVWAYGRAGLELLSFSPFCRYSGKKTKTTYALMVSQKIC